MDRRQFVKAGVAAATVTASGLPADAAGSTPPNILFVFADQHRAQSVGGANLNSVDNAYTPNLDAFRNAGFTMKNCVSNYPLCSPYRAILQTGRWPYKNGVTGNQIVGGTAKQKQDIHNLNTSVNYGATIGQYLQGHGYYTGYIGKWDLYADDPATGSYFAKSNQNRFNYDEWIAWYNNNDHYVGTMNGNQPTASNSSYYYFTGTVNGVQYTDASKHYFAWPPNNNSQSTWGSWNPQYQTQQATDFISRNASNPKPWMLFVSYNVPHPAYNAPQGPYSANATVTPRPDTGPASQWTAGTNGLPLPDKNVLFRPPMSGDSVAHQDPSQCGANNCTSYAESNATTIAYYEGITNIDTQFQTLVNAVNQAGLANNTIIIYTADHGDMMGSYRLAGKQLPLDESIKVPFYVGGKIGGQAISGSYNGMFSSIDIAPTLMGLAGFAVPAAMDGKNFASVVQGTATDIPNPYQFVFIMNGHGDPANGSGDDQFSGWWAAPVYRGLRGIRYTYTCVATDNMVQYQNGIAVGPYRPGHWMLLDNNNPDAVTNAVTSTSTYPTGSGLPGWTNVHDTLLAYLKANGSSDFGNDQFRSPVIPDYTG